jgi:hypothetical protein
MLSTISFRNFALIENFIYFLNFMSIFVMEELTTFDEINSWCEKIKEEARLVGLAPIEYKRKIVDFFNGVSCPELKYYLAKVFLVLLPIKDTEEELDKASTGFFPLTDYDAEKMKRFIQTYDNFQKTKTLYEKIEPSGKMPLLTEEEITYLVEQVKGRKKEIDSFVGKTKMQKQDYIEYIYTASYNTLYGYINKKILDEIVYQKSIRKWECGCYVGIDFARAAFQTDLSSYPSYEIDYVLKRYNALGDYQQMKRQNTINPRKLPVQEEKVDARVLREREKLYESDTYLHDPFPIETEYETSNIEDNSEDEKKKEKQKERMRNEIVQDNRTIEDFPYEETEKGKTYWVDGEWLIRQGQVYNENNELCNVMTIDGETKLVPLTNALSISEMRKIWAEDERREREGELYDSETDFYD